MLHACSIFVSIMIKMQGLPDFKWKEHRQFCYLHLHYI